MRDISDILIPIRDFVLDSIRAQKPTNIIYGTVISVSPLKVQVDQKTILEKAQLKLTRAVRDYEVEMTVDHVTESTSGGSGEASFAAHQHEYKGKKTFIVHNGLKVGDKVTMIMAQGGQQYIIIDKEV